MILVRLRRCAWMLVLVLAAGLGLPVLASAAPAQASGHERMPAAMHVHADATAHRHGAAGTALVAEADAKANPQHCPCCPTAADCALSCFGVALLPVLPEWTPLPVRAAWIAAAVPVQPGVVPSGDIDPPRPVLIG